MKVILFTKPACPQCVMTKRALGEANIEIEEIDVTQDQTALSTIQEKSFRSVPVVRAGDQWWSGFRPDLIRQFIAAPVMV